MDSIYVSFDTATAIVKWHKKTKTVKTASITISSPAHFIAYYEL